MEQLKTAPRYVRERYHAIAQLAQKLATFTREEVAKTLGRSVRSVYRYKARFRESGIAGLFKRSTRPKTSPKKTPETVAREILLVRAATGLGQEHVARLVGKTSGKTVHRILVENEVIKGERRQETEWRFFEWKRPNDLIQADITFYHGVPLLTCEDDHSRHAWACVLKDEDAITTYWALKRILPAEFENLLTDNGPQFARNQPLMREYCQAHVRRKHINARAYHPQTLGKLGAFQKALKRFLRHVTRNSTDNIPHWIDVFVSWWNGGRFHKGIRGIPDARYLGKVNGEADRRFLEAFKERLGGASAGRE